MLEPTEEAALPEGLPLLPVQMNKERMRSPPPSSSSSQPGIELKYTLDIFCNKMVSAINGLTKAVESPNGILKQLTKNLQTRSLKDRKPPVSRISGEVEEKILVLATHGLFCANSSFLCIHMNYIVLYFVYIKCVHGDIEQFQQGVLQ